MPSSPRSCSFRLKSRLNYLQSLCSNIFNKFTESKMVDIISHGALLQCNTTSTTIKETNFSSFGVVPLGLLKVELLLQLAEERRFNPFELHEVRIPLRSRDTPTVLIWIQSSPNAPSFLSSLYSVKLHSTLLSIPSRYSLYSFNKLFKNP